MRLHVLDLNSSGPWTGFVVPRDVNRLARLFFPRLVALDSLNRVPVVLIRQLRKSRNFYENENLFLL